VKEEELRLKAGGRVFFLTRLECAAVTRRLIVVAVVVYKNEVSVEQGDSLLPGSQRRGMGCTPPRANLQDARWETAHVYLSTT